MKNGKLMQMRDLAAWDGERGSALVRATLITVIMTLLGTSHLMMAQTENTIAGNERNSTMALHVAEAGAHLVVAWFNNPSTTGFLVPTAAEIDRTHRVLDHEFDPGTARVLAAAGDATKPLYKDAGVTTSAVFDRPYRAALADSFYGIESGADSTFPNDGPDVVVTDAHLATINNTLFPNFPSPDLQARIARIEIYGPPVISIGGTPTRMGVATIKVVGGMFMYPGTSHERQIATRVVKAVVDQIPVPGLAGPLQSCADLSYNGSYTIHWGAGTAEGNADIPSNLDKKQATGLPYAPDDPFNFINGANTLADWATAYDTEAIEDPWARLIAGGAIDEATNTNPQPWPHAYPGTTDTDHSNLFQFTLVDCPTFEYNLWKSIARSGGKNHYYFTSAGGGNFQLNGAGPVMDFATASSGLSAVMFFDTIDGLPPRGLYTDSWPTTNLTDAITINGSDNWSGVQGVLYLNAKEFRTTGAGVMGTRRTIFPPGEPGDGSGFVNLDYPGTLDGEYIIRDGTVNFETVLDPVTGDWYCTDAIQCDAVAQVPSLVPVQDAVGLPFQDTLALDGVLYSSGTVTAAGNAIFFGSIIAEQGVIGGSGNPRFYFDESLMTGNWPRKGMDVPRVIVTAWQTDP